MIKVSRRSAETYKKISFSSIFSHFGPFSQDFGQVKESDILDLHEMVRESYSVASAMVFDLLADLSRQAGLSKLTKSTQF